MDFFKKYKIFYPPITNHPDTNITFSGTIPQSKGKLIDNELIVRAGTILPNNDSTAQFVVNDTFVVTEGDAHGSLITMGRVLRQRLPEAPTQAAISSLASHGIFVEDADETSRPNFGEVKDLPPIATPVLTNNTGLQRFSWSAIPNAKAYLVYANNRVVSTIFANGTLEYTYGDVFIDTDFNVKAIGDNLNYGNSEMSETLTIRRVGTLAEGGTL